MNINLALSMTTNNLSIEGGVTWLSKTFFKLNLHRCTHILDRRKISIHHTCFEWLAALMNYKWYTAAGRIFFTSKCFCFFWNGFNKLGISLRIFHWLPLIFLAIGRVFLAVILARVCFRYNSCSTIQCVDHHLVTTFVNGFTPEAKLRSAYNAFVCWWYLRRYTPLCVD